MSTLAGIIVFCLAGGILSVLAAALFLILPENRRNQAVPHLVSFAIGALLGASLLGLLPHALGSPYITDMHHITLALLIGLLGFFLLEKMVLWRHCHSHDCEAHTPEPEHGHHHGHSHNNSAAGTLVLIGDGLHNFVDGILIAAAFLTDFHLGVVTALAVAAHEIPQEVGDFAVLLHSGFTRKRALFFNVLSSLATVVGGVLAYFMLSGLEHIVPYVLAVAASSFLYVAVADLIPGLHQRNQGGAAVQQIVLISSGVVTIYLVHSTLH